MTDRDLEGWTIVFDLDGTLVDSAPDLTETLNRLLVEEGLPDLPTLLARLSAESGPLVFMLWGAHAQRAFGAAGKRHLVLTYSHPSPLSRAPFVHCTHFAEANAFLEQHGRGGVDWSIV